MASISGSSDSHVLKRAKRFISIPDRILRC